MGKRRKSHNDRETRVTVDWDWFEIALGHDGFGRGDPEPVLLLALYQLDGERAQLICRGISRAPVSSPYPASIDRTGKPSLSQRLPSGDGPLGLLVIALEEDGGGDLREIYAALERGEFTLWADQHAEPEPRPLAEWIKTQEGSHSVNVLESGAALSERCDDDDYVGAAMAVFGARTLKSRRSVSHRLHFRSADGNNDWTAEVVVRA